MECECVLIRTIGISIHFPSLAKNHGFFKLLVGSVDMTKCTAKVKLRYVACMYHEK